LRPARVDSFREEAEGDEAKLSALFDSSGAARSDGAVLGNGELGSAVEEEREKRGREQGSVSEG